MSAALDRFLNPAHLQAMLSNDKAMGIALPLREFRVQVGPKNAPRLSFAAMARSSTECFMQHADLADAGERVVILAVVTPVDRALAEKFAGEPYELKGAK